MQQFRRALSSDAISYKSSDDDADDHDHGDGFDRVVVVPRKLVFEHDTTDDDENDDCGEEGRENDLLHTSSTSSLDFCTSLENDARIDALHIIDRDDDGDDDDNDGDTAIAQRDHEKKSNICLHKLKLKLEQKPKSISKVPSLSALNLDQLRAEHVPAQRAGSSTSAQPMVETTTEKGKETTGGKNSGGGGGGDGGRRRPGQLRRSTSLFQYLSYELNMQKNVFPNELEIGPFDSSSTSTPSRSETHSTSTVASSVGSYKISSNSSSENDTASGVTTPESRTTSSRQRSIRLDPDVIRTPRCEHGGYQGSNLNSSLVTPKQTNSKAPFSAVRENAFENLAEWKRRQPMTRRQLHEQHILRQVQLSSEHVRKSVYNFYQVPFQLEKFLTFGFLVCLDSFLFYFTFLPLRILYNMMRIILFGEFSRIDNSFICDMLKGAALSVNIALVAYIFDYSYVYHMIRGEAALKLYVVFTMLEVFDKLLAPIGQDIQDTMFFSCNTHQFSKITAGSDGKAKTSRQIVFNFLQALFGIFAHQVYLCKSFF